MHEKQFFICVIGHTMCKDALLASITKGGGWSYRGTDFQYAIKAKLT